MLLAGLGLISLPVTASDAPGSPPAPVVLSSADTMEKVFRDETWNKPPVEKLVIQAARNEVEGIQLVVAPSSAALRDATLDLSDLKAKSGAVISRENLTWHVVGYVQTEKPPYPVNKVGWWPDPLLANRRYDVPVGQVQPLWINVRVPADVAPGVYRGQATVRLPDGSSSAVPLEVRVWDFAIPQQQHLETCFPMRPDQLKRFYKLDQVSIEMYEQWIDFCLQHRISINLCDWQNYRTDMERLAARQLDGGGSAFCLGYAWFTPGEPDARTRHNADMVAQIKTLYDRAKQRGWIDRAYIYCHDEIGKDQFTFAHELYGELSFKNNRRRAIGFGGTSAVARASRSPT
jgi:hypothetical protein